MQYLSMLVLVKMPYGKFKIKTMGFELNINIIEYQTLHNAKYGCLLKSFDKRFHFL